MHCCILSILASALLVISGASAASRCVLPVPDGGDAVPSPPSLRGTILSVSPGEVVVRVEGAEMSQRVAVAPTTELFTVYGGGFEPGDLRSGQHAIIWYEHCTAPKRGTPAAAVLQICSLAPEPCPG